MEVFFHYIVISIHSHRPLVYHLTLHLSLCLPQQLFWFSMDNSGWKYCLEVISTLMRPGKLLNTFNAVVAAFPQDISSFLSFPCSSEFYLRHWNFLEGYISQMKLTWQTFVRSEESNLLGPVSFNIFLHYHLLWDFSQCFLLLERIIVSE